MSFHTLSEELAHLRRDHRLLVQRTGHLLNMIEALVTSFELDLRQAEAVSLESANADVARIRTRLDDHVYRTGECAATARQLCFSAREQHAACRVPSHLDGDGGAGEQRTHAVLVVDDYGDARELVADILQNAGFVVRTAANGLEGLIAANEMRPDVIVMDVAMPVLDGIQATRLIRAREATRHARVIAYTGTPPEDVSAQSLFDAVLEKPASPDVVLAMVQHVATL
jgi:two-component system, cell cycle response regulator DivK